MLLSFFIYYFLNNFNLFFISVVVLVILILNLAVKATFINLYYKFFTLIFIFHFILTLIQLYFSFIPSLVLVTIKTLIHCSQSKLVKSVL